MTIDVHLLSSLINNELQFTRMKRTISIAAFVVMCVMCCFRSPAQEMPHVYINPGHGGHDSDDRNMVIPMFSRGDTLGFWESNSNMWKAFALKEILTKKGYKTSISRIANTTADDLPLSTIVALSNRSGADIFFSIHSNGTGYGEEYRINFPMGIYRGYSGSPQVPGSDSLVACLGPYLLANQSTVWTNPQYAIYGDWTYYPHWGTQGLGVLRGNKVVSMLSEGSHHDYYPEAYRLINHGYCWVEGFNFSRAADKYFQLDGTLGSGLITGNIRDDRLLRTYLRIMEGDDVLVPVDNATVKLYDNAGNLVETVKTDTIRNGIYLFKYVHPGHYTVEVSEDGHHTQTKEVDVVANAPTYCNFYLQRVRDTAPEVVAYSPVWNDGDNAVLCNTPIVLDFNWDMDPESVEQAFKLTPEVEGSFRWEDSHYRLIFTPDDAYTADTDYTLTLGKDAKHGGGVGMNEEFSLKFHTLNRTHINELATFPGEGDAVHYAAGALVEFRSDSLLNAKDLFNYFHVFDKDGNELEFSKRSIKNNKKGDAYGYIRLPLLKELNPGEDYTLVIDKNVSDTVGINLPASITYRFTAVDASQQGLENQVLEEFETADKFTVIQMRNGATGTLTANSDRLFGSKSMQIAYSFAFDNPAVLRIDADESLNLTYRNGQSIGLYVMGDMSYNTLNARLINSEDDVQEVPLTKLTYHGWRYCEVMLDNLKEGSDYRLDGFDIVKNTTKMGRSGSIRLDNLVGVKPAGIREVSASDVSISPNPACDYIVADAAGIVNAMELYDLNGRLVARNAANYINVTDIEAGVYVVNVYTAGRKMVKKIIVAH